MQLVLVVLAAALAAAASDPVVLFGRTYFVKAIDFDDAASYYTVRHTWRIFPLFPLSCVFEAERLHVCS